MKAMTELLATMCIGVGLLLATPAAAQQPPMQRLVPGLYLGPSYDTESRRGAELDQDIHNRDYAPRADDPPRLPAGADVQARTGGVLGRLAGAAWNEQEGTWYLVITDPQDRNRIAPASSVWQDDSGLVVSSLTAYQFRRLPELPAQR